MEFAGMRQYSTETIPTRSRFYKETDEAYCPYSNFLKNNISDFDSTTYIDWEPEDKLKQNDNNLTILPLPSDSLSDMLVNQFNRLEPISHAPSLVSFMYHSAIRKSDYDASTAPVEKKTLHFLRKFIDQIEKIEAINKSFDLINSEEVNEYLMDNPFIVEVLLSGLKKINEIFGNDIKIELEIIIDPEAIKKTSILFAYIITTLSPEIVLNLLDRFDAEWYIEQSNDVLEILNFSIKT